MMLQPLNAMSCWLTPLLLVNLSTLYGFLLEYVAVSSSVARGSPHWVVSAASKHGHRRCIRRSHHVCRHSVSGTCVQQ